MAARFAPRLRSRASWRVLALFALTGLAPVLLTGILSYQRSTDALRESVLMHLRDQAKIEGMRLLGRIDGASETTRSVVAHLANGEVENAETVVDADVYLDAVLRLGGESADGPPIGRRIGDHPVLRDPNVLMIAAAPMTAIPTAHIVDDGDAAALLFVYPGAAGLSSSERFVAAFDLSLLRIPDEYLSSRMDFCLFAEPTDLIACSGQLSATAIPSDSVSSLAEPNDGFSWNMGEDEMLSATWELFLQGKYGARSIKVAAIANQDEAFGPMRNYQQFVPPVIMLVALLVCLATYRVVKGNLEPLESLTDISRAYARGDFRRRCDIRTGDEFESLGDAFNEMAAGLNNQFETLKAIARIDRMIADSAGIEQLAQVVLSRATSVRRLHQSAILVFDQTDPARAQLYASPDLDLPDGDGLIISARQRHQLAAGGDSDWHPLSEAGLPESIDAALDGSRYVMHMPILFNEVCKGVILLGSAKDEPLGPNLLTQLSDLAAHLGIGIANNDNEEKLYRQAHYDSLTGLPNRELLRDRVRQAINRANKEGERGAILFLDLDRFKNVNDVFGHSVGDTVLREATDRLLAEIWDGCTLARLGGDEFVVLLPSINDRLELDNLAARIVTALSRPFEIEGDEQHLGVSAGVVMFPDDGESFESLLRNADQAMYRAKEAGRSRYEYFSERMSADNQRRLVIERDLRRALADGALELYYQPQFNIASGELRGAEALLRWNHPSLGPLSPAEFIPVAESSDLIVDLGYWVLDQACSTIRHLLDCGLHPGVVSINVSARQLRDASFSSRIAACLGKYAVNPGFLELEITESVVAQNRESAVQLLGRLRSLGVEIAMDDFGTGYSSLSHLQQLPFDILKIDRSFVQELGRDNDGICKAIISMSQQLGKKTIAEGIETDQQLARLRRYGCDIAQGYYFSKPLPVEEFLLFIDGQSNHTGRRKALEVV